MADQLNYRGRNLASVHIKRTGGRGLRFILVANNLRDLADLLRIPPEENIELDGVPRTFDDFSRTILEKTDTIYPSLEAYVLYINDRMKEAEKDYERKRIGGLDTNNG